MEVAVAAGDEKAVDVQALLLMTAAAAAVVLAMAMMSEQAQLHYIRRRH